MSHPQPKRPSAAELIELHSKARVRSADRLPVEAMIANLSGAQHRYSQISDADARAQVARLR